jgi:hypothetical protein
VWKQWPQGTALPMLSPDLDSKGSKQIEQVLSDMMMDCQRKKIVIKVKCLHFAVPDHHYFETGLSCHQCECWQWKKNDHDNEQRTTINNNIRIHMKNWGRA